MLEPAIRRSLFLTLALALAPLLPQLPLPLAIATPVLALVMLWLRQRWHVPAIIKAALTFFTVMLVMAMFNFRLGRDTGCALLAVMLALKPLETYSLRDARSLIGFALFAPFATFLLDQGPLSLLLGLAATLSALVSLQRLADVEAGIVPLPTTGSLANTGKLVALALPLTLVAFWLLPRLPNPLWGLPDRASGKIGLSDSMSPGDWLDLMNDDTPALRVRFAGEIPPNSQLYWRGPVLWDFDGRTWRGSREPFSASPPSLTPGAVRWRYQMEVEPSERTYITALDLPLAAPAGSLQSPDGNLLSPQKLQSLSRWQVESAPVQAFQPTLSDAERARALRFPRQFNPRAQQLARRWQTETPGDAEAIVQKAMALVNAELAYSLDAPMLGRDTVDEFLFEKKVGYCEHFSSAFVFLMRSAGVPARVVTGYTGGYRNPVGGYFIVRNSDAHAWAEVWLEGRGWVRFDPTAAVAPERIYDTVADRMPGNLGAGVNLNAMWNLTDFLRSGWNDFVLGFNAERQTRMFQHLGIARIHPEQLMLLLAVCVLLTVAGMAWWLARGERERDPLLRAWHQLSHRHARLGLARQAHESARDWSERIAAAQPHKADEIRALATAFDMARYRDSALSQNEYRQLLQRLRHYRP